MDESGDAHTLGGPGVSEQLSAILTRPSQRRGSKGARSEEGGGAVSKPLGSDDVASGANGAAAAAELAVKQLRWALDGGGEALDEAVRGHGAPCAALGGCCDEARPLHCMTACCDRARALKQENDRVWWHSRHRGCASDTERGRYRSRA